MSIATEPLTVNVEIRPRKQFRAYLQRTQRFACLVCHRRAGKTVACLQDLIIRSQSKGRENPPRRYAYIAPTQAQAKDVAWGMLKRFVGAFPEVKINEADLLVTFANGATIRLYSGENFERMRGLYFDMVVLDEYGDLDPQAWQAVVRPALSDYQGGATFIGTPKGRNGFYRQWQVALKDPDFYTLMLKADDSGIIDPDELASIKAGTPERVYAQEFLCSFSVGRAGAIYARYIEEARNAKRISDDIMWHKECPVFTSWDVGAPLNQRVWLWQIVGDRIVFLESLFGSHDCATPSDWSKRLLDKQYQYGSHFIPHDAATMNGGLWQGQLGIAGLKNVVPVPRQNSVWDGINLAIESMGRVSFIEASCEAGIDSLDQYHSKEENDGVTIKDVPVHDHSSHAADAFSLAFQAIKHGLVIDRASIPQKLTMFSGMNKQRRAIMA